MPIHRPKTKIICTLGPATSSEETISAMVESGMSVARLNLSHGSLDQHRKSGAMVRSVSERLDIPVSTMIDVPGIKYRTGPLGDETLHLEPGDTLSLTSRETLGTKDLVSVVP